MSALHRAGHRFGHLHADGQSRVVLGDLIFQCGDDPLSDTARQKALLSALSYKHMNARRVQLESTRAKHLQWIWAGYDLFDEIGAHESAQGTGLVASGGHQQDPGFVEWLRSKDSLFWLSRKPASGKSTLIQYLSKHELSSRILKNATRDDWLIIHFHFDYRAHKEMANSMEGMMRSLLCQLVLKSRPIFQFIANSHSGLLIDTKFHDVAYVALQDIVSSSIAVTASHVCIFLDGLDEFEGDLRSLIACAKDLASVNGIKLCLASRPEPILRHAFRQVRTISMQDFNQYTICDYTEECLTEYADYLEGSSALGPLLKQVVDQSEGVILWTHFACRELVDGLLAQEQIEELLARLDSYPSDLIEVYERLLAKTDSRFRTEIVTTLYLIDKYEGPETPLRQLSPMLSWLRKQGFITSYPRHLLNEQLLQTRLYSRLGGLIDMIHNSYARLIHKTLSTFLKNSEAYKQDIPQILISNAGVGSVWTFLYCNILSTNVVFASQTIHETVAKLVEAKFRLSQSQNMDRQGCIEMYALLATWVGMPAEDIRIDCAALTEAFGEIGDNLVKGSSNIDSIEDVACREAIMNDIVCLHKISLWFHRFSFDWSFKEWLAISQLPPMERVLLFCLESGASDDQIHKIINQIAQPALKTIEKCLLVTHLYHHYSAEMEDESNASSLAEEVEKWLLKWLPQDEADGWRVSRDGVLSGYMDNRDVHCDVNQDDEDDDYEDDPTVDHSENSHNRISTNDCDVGATSDNNDADSYDEEPIYCRCQCPVVLKHRLLS